MEQEQAICDTCRHSFSIDDIRQHCATAHPWNPPSWSSPSAYRRTPEQRERERRRKLREIWLDHFAP